jgi:hypothetical protein
MEGNIQWEEIVFVYHYPLIILRLKRNIWGKVLGLFKVFAGALLLAKLELSAAYTHYDLVLGFCNMISPKL